MLTSIISINYFAKECYMTMNESITGLAYEMAKRLSALRLQKAWSRQELSKRSGVNVYTLKHFERTGQISLPRLIALSESLGVLPELEKLFKLRRRIDVNTWEVDQVLARQRGRKIHEEEENLVDA
jgi:transcriptional regulator with XRE-family HTH domain